MSANMCAVSAERNKSRVLDPIERVMNGHDADALAEFTSNPAVLGAGRGVVQAFPDVQAQVQWIVADGDMVVVFYSIRGTQRGPWLFVREPTGSVVETAFRWRSGSMTTGKSSINGSGQTSSRCSCSWAGALPRSAKLQRSRTDESHLDRTPNCRSVLSGSEVERR
jgi:hypothetical protein